jgi:hypothetical protein
LKLSVGFIDDACATILDAMALEWPDTKPGGAFRDATASFLLLDNAVKEVRKLSNFTTCCSYPTPNQASKTYRSQ